MKKKVPVGPFRPTRPVHRKHLFIYGTPHVQRRPTRQTCLVVKDIHIYYHWSRPLSVCIPAQCPLVGLVTLNTTRRHNHFLNRHAA